jgi:hypothetical protein
MYMPALDTQADSVFATKPLNVLVIPSITRKSVSPISTPLSCFIHKGGAVPWAQLAGLDRPADAHMAHGTAFDNDKASEICISIGLALLLRIKLWKLGYC